MSLTEVLTVGSAHDALSGVVEGALAAIAWRDSGDTVGGGPPTYGLSSDGSWTTPMLSGRADPLHPTAELIGESARQAARQRRVDALTAQITDLDTTIEAERAAIADAMT